MLGQIPSRWTLQDTPQRIYYNNGCILKRSQPVKPKRKCKNKGKNLKVNIIRNIYIDNM